MPNLVYVTCNLINNVKASIKDIAQNTAIYKRANTGTCIVKNTRAQSDVVANS